METVQGDLRAALWLHVELSKANFKRISKQAKVKSVRALALCCAFGTAARNCLVDKAMTLGAGVVYAGVLAIEAGLSGVKYLANTGFLGRKAQDCVDGYADRFYLRFGQG